MRSRLFASFSIDVFFKVVKSLTPSESTFVALAISSNVDKISAADLHVAPEQIDAAQAKIDRLTRELEIEQVSRHDAEAICQVVAAKLHSRPANITAERDEPIHTIKELAFARALLTNDLLADDEQVAFSNEFFADYSDDKTTDSIGNVCPFPCFRRRLIASLVWLCSHLDTFFDFAFLSIVPPDHEDAETQGPPPTCQASLQA